MIAKILGMILTLGVMAGIAHLVWRAVQRQEAGDKELEDKLHADDERARRAREAQRHGQPPPGN